MKVLALAVLLAAITSPVNAVDAGQVAHRNVSFVSQGVTLRGTIYIPKTPSFAAAVWVRRSSISSWASSSKRRAFT